MTSPDLPPRGAPDDSPPPGPAPQSGYPQPTAYPQPTGYPQQAGQPGRTGYPQQAGYPQPGHPPQAGYPQPDQPQQSGYPQQGGQQRAAAVGYAQAPAPGYGPAPVAVGPPTQVGWQPVQAPPWAPAGQPRRGRRIGLELTFVILGGILAAAFVLLMALVTSGGAVLAAAFAGLVPLAIVLGTILWIDRWEPEPRFLLVAGLLWGAGVAVAGASLLNGVVGLGVRDLLGLQMDDLVAMATFGAPIVEELLKGLGLLLIFLVRRRHFNGPVDGVVYAAVIGSGFAFVENIQYFSDAGERLVAVFVMRGLLSPFNHLIFTACTGLALGWASRARSRYAWVWAFPLGFVVAALLHGAWNGTASTVTTLGQMFGLFALLAWLPLGAMAGLVLWLRRNEARLIGQRLGDYVPAGWFSPAEVHSLTSLRARSQARLWAGRAGPDSRKAMKRYQHAATSLAYARQDLYSGHGGIRAREDEIELLTRMAQARQEVAVRTAAMVR